jgi:SNF family Na+-dependent transporter
MSPGLRKFALTAHLAVSIGWIGAVAAYLTLDVTVATSEDPQSLRAAWIGMGAITSRAIVPLAVASLLTGLVMSLGTKWGLFRHWWVLISFLLTTFATIVLLSETGHISHAAAVAVDPTTSDEALRALPNTLLHSIGGMVVLLVVQVLNMYKPRGLTRYGWRRQQAEGRAAQRPIDSPTGPQDL